jgi:1-acyl-sn-glycerol-3-phosphate acyltransferase
VETQPNGSKRDGVINAIVAFLAGQDLLSLDDVRSALEREIDSAGPGALLALKEALTADVGWGYYPRDALAQRIHHLLADRFLQADSHLSGTDHVTQAPDGPVVIFSNHLSYADANVFEVLLQRSGAAAVADRLTAIAGPKVFTSRQRRFSSLCFGTIKVPQSADVSTDEAVLSPREVARAARCSINAAHARLAHGDALLVFAEGTRSRSGGMQPMLAGVARYLDVPGTSVVPVGLTGSEALFPIGHEAIRPARIIARIGQPISAGSLARSASGDRRLIIDAIGLAIAGLLPEAYRGAYRSGETFASASRVLSEARRTF